MLLTCFGAAVAGIIVLAALVKYLKYTTDEINATPPPCLNDPKWGNHEYVNLNGPGGLKMHYVEKGDKEKPLMLFLHGFPEFWYSWRHQIKHHSKHCWCVAPDMRGYGDTDKPEGVSQYSLDHLTEDIKHLIHALNRSKCILVGHDWGGAVGYAFCHRYPDMVDAFIAINTVHLLSLGRDIINRWEQRLSSWYVYYFQLPYIPELMFVRRRVQFFKRLFEKGGLLNDPSLTTAEDIEAYVYAFRRKHTWTCALNYYRAGPRYPFYSSDHPLKMIFYPDIYKDLKKITVPVYSIFGTADKFISVSAAQGCKDFCENFQETFMDNVRHFSQMEVPDQVNSLMDKYLAECGFYS